MKYPWDISKGKNVEVLKATKSAFFEHIYEQVVALRRFPKGQRIKLIWRRLGRLFAKIWCLSYALERPFWEKAFAVTNTKIPQLLRVKMLPFKIYIKMCMVSGFSLALHEHVDIC